MDEPDCGTSFPYRRLVPRGKAGFGRNRLDVDPFPKHSADVRRRAARNWFHTCLGLSTQTISLALLTIWTLAILFFAGMYILIDNNTELACGLSESSDLRFNTAFAFSLETATTVGYGLPGPSEAFFENCPWMQFVIYWQVRKAGCFCEMGRV